MDQARVDWPGATLTECYRWFIVDERTGKAPAHDLQAHPRRCRGAVSRCAADLQTREVRQLPANSRPEGP
jgi:hypothetical protein